MIKRRLYDIGHVLKVTAKTWFDRDPFRESAIIAYNAIFSLPGLLVLVLTISGYVFGAEAVNGNLHTQISKMMGSDTADQIQEMVLMAHKSKESIWATIVGIVVIIIGATGVFVQLQKSFDNIWGVAPTKHKSGIRSFIMTRIFSFGLIISIAFLLLVSLVITSVLAAFGTWIELHWSDSWMVLFQFTNFLISLLVITTLFALMFKILPDAKVRWKSVWIGAFVTALLFVLGKTGLGFYFGKANPASGYGAAGSIVLILLWTSYSSMIVFFGAEFTKAYSVYHFGQIVPAENAEEINSNKV